MSSMSTHYFMADLPWSPSREEEQRFRKILLWILFVFLLLGLIMPILPVREQTVDEVVVVPPRLARILEQRKQTEIPPQKQAQKLEPKLEEPKIKKKAKPKKIKPKLAERKKKSVDPQAARKKAQSSGLLAFSDDLADLRDSHALEKLNNRSLQKSGKQMKRTTRSLVTAKAGKGSSGINTASLSRETGGAGIGGRNTTRVSVPKSSQGAAGGGQGGTAKGRSASRDLEKIQMTFDRNKGAIYAIYNRALRKNPSLQGKVVLKITIAPSGKVTSCHVVSSELKDPKLERKLAQRVKMINFGAAEVTSFTFSYPIDFFPA